MTDIALEILRLAQIIQKYPVNSKDFKDAYWVLRKKINVAELPDQYCVRSQLLKALRLEALACESVDASARDALRLHIQRSIDLIAIVSAAEAR